MTAVRDVSSSRCILFLSQTKKKKLSGYQEIVCENLTLENTGLHVSQKKKLKIDVVYKCKALYVQSRINFSFNYFLFHFFAFVIFV